MLLEVALLLLLDEVLTTSPDTGFTGFGLENIEEKSPGLFAFLSFFGGGILSRAWEVAGGSVNARIREKFGNTMTNVGQSEA